jgi:hypothetical protein
MILPAVCQLRYKSDQPRARLARKPTLVIINSSNIPMRKIKSRRKVQSKATPKRTSKAQPRAKRKKQVSSPDPNELFRRIHRELIDDFDEELEMEREDWEITETGATAKPIESDADANISLSSTAYRANSLNYTTGSSKPATVS